MNNNTAVPNTVIPNNDEVSERVGFGLVGAFLFSLAGGIIWFVLWQINIIAGISGFIAVICAIRGYAFFAKKESLKGVILSTIIAVLVIIIAWYFCLSFDCWQAYKAWYEEGEIDYTISFFDAVRSAWMYLTEPDIAFAYLKDLVIGLIFCVIACIKPISDAIARAKAAKNPPVTAAPADVPAEMTEENPETVQSSVLNGGTDDTADK